MATVAARAADEKLATNIAVLDVTQPLTITDLFVIASAETERQVQAIVDEIEFPQEHPADQAVEIAAGNEPVLLRAHRRNHPWTYRRDS